MSGHGSRYKASATSQFKKDYKKAKWRSKDMSCLDKVILMLANGEALPAQMRDHELSGVHKGFRECHIEPDWLLIYKVKDEKLVLVLMRTGSHSDLFG